MEGALAEIHDHRVLGSGLHVTSYDDGKIHLEVPPAGQGESWQKIILRDVDVFELMSWMAGVKLPKSDNEIPQ